MTLTAESFFDWESVTFSDVVPYPERYADVVAEHVYWSNPWPGNELVRYVGPPDAGGVRWVRNYELPPDLGVAAWRRHDPAHPRCWYCGKFTSPRLRGVFVPPCRDCGESVGGPW